MKLFFTLIIGLYGILSLSGQPPLFSKVFYDNSGSVNAFSIAKTYDQQLMICGTLNNDALLMKTTATGTIAWVKKFGNTNNTAFSKIIATGDSCFIVLGKCNNTVSGNTDICYMKVNTAGVVQWSYAIDLLKNEDGLSIERTNDNGYIIGGYSSQSSPSYSSIVVAKINATGNPEWIRKIDGGNKGNMVMSIKPTTDNGFIMTGNYVNYISPTYDNRAFLMKLQPNGDISWAKVSASSTQYSGGLDVQVLNNGYLWLLESINCTFFVKTDLNGNAQWEKQMYTYVNALNYGYSIPHLRKVSSNKYIFTGANYNMNGFHCAIDTLANILWCNRAQLMTTDCITTSDTAIVLVGNGPLFGVKLDPPSNPQVGLLKTDSMGMNGASCVYNSGNSVSSSSLTFSDMTYTSMPAGAHLFAILPVTTSTLAFENRCVAAFGSIAEEKNNRSEIIVFPNPANNSITINFNKKCPGLITISDINGRQLIKLQNESLQRQIDISSLVAGVYFVKVQYENEFSIAKFVKD